MRKPLKNFAETPQKKEETPQLNEVFKNTETPQKKRKHLNYKYWETIQKYLEIPHPFPVLRDFPKKSGNSLKTVFEAFSR